MTTRFDKANDILKNAFQDIAAKGFLKEDELRFLEEEMDYMVDQMERNEEIENSLTQEQKDHMERAAKKLGDLLNDIRLSGAVTLKA